MEILGIVYVSNWLLVLVGFLTFLYLFYTWRFDELKKLGVPHPKPIPFFGNTFYILKHGFHKCDIVLEKEFGNIFGWYENRKPVIASTDPDILRHVLIKEFHNFTDRRPLYFRGRAEHGLFELKGDRWRGMRNLLTPSFSSGKLKLMLKHMQTSVDHLLNQMNSHIKNNNGTFESKEAAGMFTMDVIGGTVFGIDLDCRNDPNNTIAQMARRMLDVKIWSLPMMLIVNFEWLCPLIERFVTLNMFDKEAEDYLAKVITEAIDVRRKSKVQSNDFLGILINAEKNKDASVDEEDIKQTSAISKLKELTEEEVIANGLLFFGAGFETTATTLGFLLYHLAVNEDVQERLRQDILDVIGDKPVTYEDLGKFEFLEQCINETLRVCPPVFRVDRLTKNDIKVGNLFVPQGTLFVLPIMALHKNPVVWPDPEKWDPDRFSPEERASRDPIYFVPFGLGPRQCIGMRLAMVELKLAVSQLLRKYKFSATPETPVPLQLKKDSLHTMAEKPLKIKVEHL